MFPSAPKCCVLRALVLLCVVALAVPSLCLAQQTQQVAAQKPYAIDATCNALRLTDDTFESDTQAAAGVTSGYWLILFVPSNNEVTSQNCSQEVVHEVKVFEAFLKLPRETLDTYQVVTAYVLCDESPAVCSRFQVDHLSSKLVLLGDDRMHPFPGDYARSVDDIEVFVTIFRRVESSPIPPVRAAVAVWGQFLILLASVVGILVACTRAMSHSDEPFPAEILAPSPRAKQQ